VAELEYLEVQDRLASLGRHAPLSGNPPRVEPHRLGQRLPTAIQATAGGRFRNSSPITRGPAGRTLPPSPLPSPRRPTAHDEPPTWENTPHMSAGSRYGPTPAAADGRADQPPVAGPRAQEQQCPPTPNPGDRPHAEPTTSAAAPFELAGSSTSALATLPEVLTVREAAAILRVGRNQLHQAVGRGQLRAVRIGRSIRIPKQALVDLLASATPH
jgi:excisionase family DNA binding protein